MSIPLLGDKPTGKHRAGTKPSQVNSSQSQLSADSSVLIAANEDLTCSLARALVCGMQEATRRAEAETENAALKARNKQLVDKVIRAEAEHRRLRKAVIDARPRITVVDTQLARPYAPEVVLPYVSPVPYRDTSGDDTQQIPLVELPPASTGQTTWGARNQQQEVAS